MGAVGPVLGGILIDSGSWRAIFLLNLPLAACAILIAARSMGRDLVSVGHSLDWHGAALATLGLFCVTAGLTLGTGRAGWSVLAVAVLATGVLLLGLFILVEKRRGAGAMLPLGLFGSRSFVGLTLLTLLLYGALGGLFVLLPYALITGGGYRGTEAGAALLPLPALIALTSPPMGAFAARHGSRLQLTVGPLIVAAGFLLALRIDVKPDFWTAVLPSVLVIALGMSAAAAPLTNAVLGSVDAAHTGAASGFNSATARTGGLIATALLGSVLAARGSALMGGFRVAMIASAASCAAASASMMLSRPGARDTRPGQAPGR